MTKTIALFLMLSLAAAGVVWWIGADAQPVTVDEIGDENQTVPRGQLPLFAAKGDATKLYAFAVDNADTLRWMLHVRLRRLRPRLEPVLLREVRNTRAGHLHEPRRDLNPVPGYHA
jgi:hypothetical protein